MRAIADRLPGLIVGLKLLRSPRELPAIVLALAVGTGLAVAAYSLIHAVLLTPLPYREPGRLVLIWNIDDEASGRRILSDRHRERVREHAAALQSPVTYRTVRQTISSDHGGPSVDLVGSRISFDLFDTLGRARRSGPDVQSW